MTSSEAPVSPPILKDPATMTAEERLATIDSYRRRHDEKGDLTADELRHVIKCIHVDRGAAIKERKSSKTSEKRPVAEPSLEDLV